MLPQSGPGSDGNEGMLRIPQSSNTAGTSPSDCLVSYQGHSLGAGSYPSAEVQSVYSTAPADWAKYSLGNAGSLTAMHLFSSGIHFVDTHVHHLSCNLFFSFWAFFVLHNFSIILCCSFRGRPHPSPFETLSVSWRDEILEIQIIEIPRYEAIARTPFSLSSSQLLENFRYYFRGKNFHYI